MKADLRALLIGDPQLSVLVGDRVHWGRRRQGGPLPAVVLHRISSSPRYSNDGPSDGEETRVQIDCWGQSVVAADKVGKVVQRLLSGFRGYQADTRFYHIFAAGGFDDDSKDPTADLFRTSEDFIIYHSKGA